MENLEDPTEELPTRPGPSEPTPDDDDPTLPGRRTEAVGARVEEHPGEGVRSHSPTDPASVRDTRSTDETSGDEGV